MGSRQAEARGEPGEWLTRRKNVESRDRSDDGTQERGHRDEGVGARKRRRDHGSRRRCWAETTRGTVPVHGRLPRGPAGGTLRGSGGEPGLRWELSPRRRAAHPHDLDPAQDCAHQVRTVWFRSVWHTHTCAWESAISEIRNNLLSILDD